jgi:hypothetical protein
VFEFTPKAGGDEWKADLSAELHGHNGYDVILMLDKVASTADSGWMLELAIERSGTISGQITARPGYDALALFESSQDQMTIHPNAPGPKFTIHEDGSHTIDPGTSTEGAALPADAHAELRSLLNELMEWNERVAGPGGHDAPIWDRIRAYRDSLFPPDPEPAEIEFTAHLERNIEVLETATVKVKATNENLAVEIVRAMNGSGQVEWQSTNIETRGPIDWEITSPQTPSVNWKDDE